MSVPALVDDYAEEFEHEQLSLDPEGFDALRSLAESGAVTAVSLRLPTDVEYRKLELLARFFGEMTRRLQWWTGDLLNNAEGSHGEKFAQLAHDTGLAEQTLLNRQYVCKHVPESRRKASLPFSVHAEVAPLDAREQKRWLDRAEKGQWTRAVMREHMKAKRKDEKPTLHDDGVELGSLLEAVHSLIANADEAGENVICRREDFSRVKAAAGEEE